MSNNSRPIWILNEGKFNGPVIVLLCIIGEQIRKQRIFIDSSPRKSAIIDFFPSNQDPTMVVFRRQRGAGHIIILRHCCNLTGITLSVNIKRKNVHAAMVDKVIFCPIIGTTTACVLEIRAHVHERGCL